ncbi:response regulator [Bacillus sp. FJAT-49711]|uniref:response regulator n=1 Tax=Bacillus sp. FJAT-49711 TaxID=2833585 RepID=UPI0032D5A825
MKVILIDDEPLALAYLEKLLGEIENLTIIGMYGDPRRALERIKHKRPEIVFLDIEMPELNGMELAEQIQNEIPEIKIVFITAYDTYAVRAFDLNAVDYIVKPVKRDRLLQTIRRFPGVVDANTVEATKPMMVRCFQTLSFCIYGDESQTVNVHWRTFKARELFAFLIQHRNQPVRKDVILDMFWPETDWKKGFPQLYATIYQIRKTLQSINVKISITSSENSYKLVFNDVLLDIDVWEKRMNELPIVTNETLPEYQKLLNFYIGDYLASDDYLWAEGERERFRGLWLQLVKKVTDYLVFRGNYSEAIVLYHRVQTIHPYFDDSYFMLMKLYDDLGDRPSVEQQYAEYTKMLLDEFGLKPTDIIKTWYDRWKLKNHK